MKSAPLVSIIIPIYNVGKYIDKCIKSVLLQTHHNLELILVDDGSPDDSGEICDLNARLDDRIRVIHKENGGVSSARNAGIQIALGDYIMFIDGDDWVDVNHVEYLLTLCEEENTLMSMSYGIHKSNSDRFVKIEDRRRVLDGETLAADLLYHKTVIGSYNKIFKRELIINNHVSFNERLFIGEGFNFIVMCAQLAGRVSTGTFATYHYRLDNPESAMTKFDIDKIHNNDLALDLIKHDFINRTHQLLTAWNYGRWITSLSFAVWAKSAKANNVYSDDYRKMLRDIRSRAPMVLIANVGMSKKISAVIALLSPKLIVKLLEIRKSRSTSNV